MKTRLVRRTALVGYMSDKKGRNYKTIYIGEQSEIQSI
jgi:hypothetical protein